MYAARKAALCAVCVGLTICTVSTDLAYAESLASLKLGAEACSFSSPSEWGTHSFRRGYASESLAAGGPSALFWAGGWRGVTDFAYADALAKGEAVASEFCINHHDSSDPDTA